MMAPCLSILGTGSDVGKSIVVTALCRIWNNRGIRVAPYKAQNMSNNSFVTPWGEEMGRAQVVQAEAARAPLDVHMNPVLLKPNSDLGSQVVVHGQAQGNKQAQEYFSNTAALFDAAKKSLAILRDQYDFIILEGAGSCAEVNLMSKDFVNFKMAHEADAPVILVADIDRGGVFAQIIGTLSILPEQDRKRVKGIIINRFRGDLSLFDEGIKYIEKETSLPVLGVIPYFRHIEIESEDGLPLETIIDPVQNLSTEKVNVAVIRFPHISNFTDFNSLQRESHVTLHYLSKPRSLLGYDLVILPGTKNVRSDLAWLKDEQWTPMIDSYVQNQGHLIGVCGGYQMLGKVVSDPLGVEGDTGTSSALNYLDIKSVLESKKVLKRVSGVHVDSGKPIQGYEIHMGRTESNQPYKPLFNLKSDHVDGVQSPSGRIWGTYMHGLFDSDSFRHHFLKSISPVKFVKGKSQQNFKDKQYDLLAEHVSQYLNIDLLFEIASKKQSK